MKDTISLLIATAILAAGGVGLYMYKSNDSEEKEGGGYDEDGLFGSTGFFGSSSEEEEPELDFDDYKDDYKDDYDYDYEYEKSKPKTRAKGGKTKRNKKSVGTKRRYYY